jgi:alpha-1,3-glucanase-like protein
VNDFFWLRGRIVVLVALLAGLLAARPSVNAQAVPARGATLPYAEMEAEDADTSGTIIGPDYIYTHLPSETSGRKAVQLRQPGQYVEFTLAQPANSIVVRYSIPDSTDGRGMDGLLGLYVNGQWQSNLYMTSAYSWFYGGYPFNNNPHDVFPHHFFDEIHKLLPEMAAGTKVRLQMESGDIAPSYTIDLADFEEVAPPLAQPTTSLSITDYGADPTGVQDSTQAMNNAIAAAKNQGKTVWIPVGNFTIMDHIVVDDVTVRGAGMWYSFLRGIGVGIYGNYNPSPSQNVHLSDFAIFGEVTDRDDSAQVYGIGGAMGGHSTIQNLWIEHTKVGMWFDGPFSDLTITGVRIRNTTADGINLHKGITNVTVEQSSIRNTGDDGLAMWSEELPDEGNVFQFNTVQLPILANNIAIYGGADNSILDNFVSDTLTEGGGIHVGNRFKSVALSGTTTIARNTIVSGGNYAPTLHFGVGALWFYALDSAMDGLINVGDLEIDDSPYEAIQFVGRHVSNLTFNNVTIHRTGTFAIQIQTGGSATFDHVIALGIGAQGVFSCQGASFNITDGQDNSGWNIGKPFCGVMPMPISP